MKIFLRIGLAVTALVLVAGVALFTVPSLQDRLVDRVIRTYMQPGLTDPMNVMNECYE